MEAGIENTTCGLYVCTACGLSLGLEHFYSKGTRRDSRCKQCVGKVKKTVYLAKQKAKRVIEEFIVTKTTANDLDAQEKLAELLRNLAMEVVLGQGV